MSKKMDKKQSSEKFKKIKIVSKWATPWGLISTILSVHVKGLTIDRNAKPHEIRDERIRNWSSIIASTIALGIAGILLWKFNIADGDRSSSVSIISALSLVVFFVLFAKIKTSFDNLATIKREFNVSSDYYTESDTNALKIDDDAASILLSRKTFYKFAYLLAAAYAFCLVLTPKNFHGLHEISKSGFAPYNVTFISLSTAFMLSAILLIRALMTNKDLNFLSRYGAKPISQGYITVHNQVQTIIQYTILGLGVTYIGDMLMGSIAKSNMNLWLAALLRPMIMVYMIIFSLKVLQSTVSFSGFQTAESSKRVGLLPILFLKTCKLPPPLDNERARILPPLTIIAALLFGIAVWLGSNSGAVAKLTSLSAVFPIALLISIQHFAPHLHDKKTSEL